MWLAHWVYRLPASGVFTNSPPQQRAPPQLWVFIIQLQTWMLQLAPIPASRILLHLLTCLELQVITYFQKFCYNISPCTKSTRIWENLQETLARLYAPVHKPQPFKGIKIWAAELVSVLLLLSDRIPGVRTVATLVFAILRNVLHLFVPSVSISVKWALPFNWKFCVNWHC